MPEFTPEQLDAWFPIRRKLDFFNHAGVAPLSAPAADSLRKFADEGESQSYVGTTWYSDIDRIRERVAGFIGAGSADEVAFVPNTSTGLALVARGLAWRPGDEVVISNVEYPANRYPWQDVQRLGVRVVEVAQRRDGRIPPEDVIACITPRTRVVSLSAVQYASGFRMDLRPIADAVHAVGGYLCVDAIQLIGLMPFDVKAIGADFVSADGHKWMLGPEGAGIFYCRRALCEALHPAVVGWLNMVDPHNYGDYRFEFEPTARRFEPGSHNLPGIRALDASLSLLKKVGLETVWSRVEALTARLDAGLRGLGYTVHSPREHASERSGIVIFSAPPGRPTHAEIVGTLQKQGIIIVVREGKLRASPHFYNTAEQIDRLVAALP